MAGINDGALWRQEYMRQFHGIKAALHSLRLQSAERLARGPRTTAVKDMAFKFALVEEAFQALNTPEPRDTSEDLYPAPAYRSKKTLDQALGLEK